MPTTQEVQEFTGFPFSDNIQRDIAAAGYVTPTPIQARAMGPALEGKDLIGLAQTGTGKTAAFALPIIQRLATTADFGALVLAPTRELVHQIVGVFRTLGQSSGIRVASIVGGVKMEHDWKALRSWPNVLVATPGRLIDHMEQKTVALGEVGILVVDEADRMHDMGFIPQIRRIIAALPVKRQTMMFTATMPPDVEQIARRHMRDPVKILVGPASRPVERAAQQLFQVPEDQKTTLLLDLLKKENGRVLIFVRTKRGVDRLARRVIGRRQGVARIHGDREQAERDEAMSGFRAGRYRILIATDIAARGLDVADIEHVINYDFPRSPEDYVHRIGRTARLEAEGRATSFVTPADRRYLKDLEKLIGSHLPLTLAPGVNHAADDGDGHPHEAPHTHRPGRHAGGRPQRSHAHAGGNQPHKQHPYAAGGHSQHAPSHTQVEKLSQNCGTPALGRANEPKSTAEGGCATNKGRSETVSKPAPVGGAQPHQHAAPAAGQGGKRRRRRRGGRGNQQGAPVTAPLAYEVRESAAPESPAIASASPRSPAAEKHAYHDHQPHAAPSPAGEAALDRPPDETATVIDWD